MTDSDIVRDFYENWFREKELMEQQEEVYSAWLDFAEVVCEREEFLSMAPHFLYIGEKL